MMLDVMLNFKDFKILKSTQLIKTKIEHVIIYISHLSLLLCITISFVNLQMF
jgi:hypothetical protein